MRSHFSVDVFFSLSSLVLYPAKYTNQTYYSLPRNDLGMQRKAEQTLTQSIFTDT
jgi:hypothetical protein